jgi:hypothetical protein
MSSVIAASQKTRASVMAIGRKTMRPCRNVLERVFAERMIKGFKVVSFRQLAGKGVKRRRLATKSASMPQ